MKKRLFLTFILGVLVIGCSETMDEIKDCGTTIVSYDFEMDENLKCFQEALSSCQPSKLTQLDGGSKIVDTIVGLNNDKCIVNSKVLEVIVDKEIEESFLIKANMEMDCEYHLDEDEFYEEMGLSKKGYYDGPYVCKGILWDIQTQMFDILQYCQSINEDKRDQYDFGATKEEYCTKTFLIDGSEVHCWEDPINWEIDGVIC